MNNSDTAKRVGKVFISHSSADRDFVDGLDRFLKENGVDTWYSRTDIEGGAHWYREIQEALETCGAFVVVVSTHSAGSKWVAHELAVARTYFEDQIIPLLLDSLDLDRFHTGLDHIHVVNFRDDRDKGRQQLLGRLRKVTGAAPAAAPAPATPAPGPGPAADPWELPEALYRRAIVPVVDSLFVAALLEPEGETADRLKALPAVRRWIQGAVRELLHKHFPTEAALKKAAQAALADAGAATTAWLEGGWSCPAWQAAEGPAVPRFRQWLRENPPAREDLRVVSENYSEKMIQKKLLEEAAALAARAAALELSRPRLLGVLSAAAGGEPPPGGAVLAPPETLLHGWFRFLGFDFFAEVFCVSFRRSLERSAELARLLRAPQRLSAAEYEVRERIARIAAALDGDIREAVEEHLGVLGDLRAVRGRAHAARERESVVQLTCGDMGRSFEALEDSFRDSISGRRETIEEVKKLMEQAETYRGGADDRKTGSEAELADVVLDRGAALFKGPAAEDVVPVIARWADFLCGEGRHGEVADRFKKYLERFGETAPGELFYLAYRAHRDARNENWAKLTADFYNEAIRRSPHLAEFPRHYKVQKLLGRGAFGPVFLVENALGVQYALKTVEPIDKKLRPMNFEGEARNQAAAARSDPTGVIVKVHDYATQEAATGRPFVLLEYVEGRNLDQLYKGEERMTGLLDDPRHMPICLGVLHRLLRAIEFLHGQKEPIIHRDLHPGNLMISSTGAVRLIDFGIAKVLPRAGHYSVSNADLTVSGQKGLGRWNYAAPEFHLGEKEHQRKPQLDVYSLGKVMSYLLTGDPNGSDRLGDGYAALREVIRRATDRQLDRRYANAAELRKAFQQAVRREAGEAGVRDDGVRLSEGELDVRDEAVRAWLEDYYPKYYPNPFKGVQTRAPKAEGVVRSVDADGLRVAAGDQVFFVPGEEVSWTRRYALARGLIRPGQQVTVQPLDAAAEGAEGSVAERKASLRQAAKSPWPAAEAKAAKGPEWLVEAATVLEVDADGAVVELEDGRDGLVGRLPFDEVQPGPTNFEPRHWLHPGDQITAVVRDLDRNQTAQEKIRLSYRGVPAVAAGVRRWQAELANPSVFRRGVVARVAAGRAYVALGDEATDPVAVVETTDEHRPPGGWADALGRRAEVLVAQAPGKAWPDAYLRVREIRWLPEADQPPLYPARVAEVDVAHGRYAVLEVEESPAARRRGRVLAGDFLAPETDDLRGVLAPGEAVRVRRLRKRPGQEWDYCVPDPWREPGAVPREGDLVTVRVTRAQGGDIEGQLPGKIKAVVPVALIRSRFMQDYYAKDGREPPVERIAAEHFLQEGQEIPAYVVGVDAERRLCRVRPRWTQDDPAAGGYLRAKYPPGARVRGIISGHRTQKKSKKVRLYVLLEPGIEAELDASAHPDPALRGKPPGEFVHIWGRPAVVTVGEYDPAKGLLLATGINREAYESRDAPGAAGEGDEA